MAGLIFNSPLFVMAGLIFNSPLFCIHRSSGGAREQIIGVHSNAKTAKKPFLRVAHMVKN
jgi:hypothetical protein